MWLVYLLAGAVVPLLITPRLFFHYDTAPKIIVLAVTAAWVLLRPGSLREEVHALSSRREGRWLIALAAAQLVWFGITTATSSRPWLSLLGSGWRRFGFIETLSLTIVAIAVAAGLSARPRDVRPLLRMIVGAGLVASIYGICEYFGVDPLQPVAAYQAHAGDSVIVRPPGTLGHADYFAWWLAIEFFCALALEKIETSPWKHVATVTAVCTFIAVLLSGTRAALLGIVAGIIGMALMSPSSFRLRRKYFLTVALGVVVFMAFLFSTAGTRLRARAVWSEDEPAGGARPLVWRDSQHMAVARPVFGFGPETFLTTFAPYQSEDLARLFPDFHHESPHNLPLDALTSMGVPGLLLVAAWGALALFAGVGARRSASPLAVPLCGALIASTTAAMFSAASPGPVLLSLLVIGMLIGLCPPETIRTAGAVRNSRNLGWHIRIPAIVLALCLVAFGAVFTDSDFQLQRFREHPGESTYLAVVGTSLPGAGEDLYVSRILQQECGKYVSFMSYLTCRQQTMRASARALHTSDDVANAWYSISMLSAAQNDITGTRRGLEEAIRASPNWFKPHWALARLLSQTGETNQASSEAVRAAFLDSNRDPEVVDTLADLKTARRR